MTAPTKLATVPPMTHEYWCQPTGERTEIRVEQFIAYRDDTSSNRSTPSVRVTRCCECGSARYDNL